MVMREKSLPELVICTGDAYSGVGIQSLCTARSGPELADEARRLAPGEEIILYLHRDAEGPLGLSRENAGEFFGGARNYGATWLYDGPPKVSIVVTDWTGDFAGASPADLWRAVRGLARAVGPYRFSAAAMVQETMLAGRWIPTSSYEPALASPPWRDPAFAVPAHAWTRTLTAADTARGWVRAFDRRGSYLAALGSAVLSAGEWVRHDGPYWHLSEGQKIPPGYWLVSGHVMGFLSDLLWDNGRPDVTERVGGGPDGGVWVTSPLAQLLADLRGYIEIDDGWSTTNGHRLESSSRYLRGARAMLADDPTATKVLKTGYAGAIAWFEHGRRPPHPLAHPHWRRTILDLHVANTYRSLQKTTERPFALTGVDTAFFAVDDPDALPADLPSEPSHLGTWKPKGRAVTMDEALSALAFGGAAELVRLTETVPA